MEFTRQELETNVAAALARANRELLPQEIRESELADWILGRGEPAVREAETPGERGGVFDYTLELILDNLLTPSFTFYYATLFYIGRQWRVSELAAENARAALEPENFEQTIALNLEAHRERLGELNVGPGGHEPLLRDTFEFILKTASQRQAGKHEQARKLWNVWQDEVWDLKNSVIDFVEGYERAGKEGADKEALPRGLLPIGAFSFHAKELYALLVSEGIVFKNIEPPFVYQNLLTTAALIPLLQERGRGTESAVNLMQTFQRNLELQLKAIEAYKLAPAVIKVQEKLFREFGDENPFDRYDIFKSPPDSRLRELWNKCTLPDGSPFYYANQWYGKLNPTATDYIYGALPFIPELFEEDIVNYAADADATIKINWATGRKLLAEPDPSELTDEELAQYYFEQSWVVPVMSSATYPTLRKVGEQEWDFESFHKMVESVVNYLNGHGYKLISPNRERLEDLWNLALTNYVGYWTQW
jgi:hypothetical protein